MIRMMHLLTSLGIENAPIVAANADRYQFWPQRITRGNRAAFDRPALGGEVALLLVDVWEQHSRRNRRGSIARRAPTADRSRSLTQHNHFQFLESIPTFSGLQHGTLIGSPFAGIFFSAREPLETAIPKKANRKTTRSRLSIGGPAPPPLNEILVAQLQNAVRAAQRKRTAQSGQPRDSSDPK